MFAMVTLYRYNTMACGVFFFFFPVTIIMLPWQTYTYPHFTIGTNKTSVFGQCFHFHGLAVCRFSNYLVTRNWTQDTWHESPVLYHRAVTTKQLHCTSPHNPLRNSMLPRSSTELLLRMGIIHTAYMPLCLVHLFIIRLTHTNVWESIGKPCSCM